MDISFKRPKRKLEKDTDTLEGPGKVKATPLWSNEHEHKVFSGIKNHIPNAVVMSAAVPISMPKKHTIRKLPPLLTSLEKRENLLLSKDELKQLCEKTFCALSVSLEQSAYLEESTRLQSLTPLWHDHRKGRITASKFHAVWHTSLSPPSKSLLKSFVNNQGLSSSKTPSLQWGIENESIAHEAYLDAVSDTHSDFHCHPTGLHINTDYPHLGASPDGIVDCDCCGEGLLEIKCPYKYRNEDPNMISDQSFYIKRDNEGEIVGLCQKHDYYYQVQGQLAICSKDYCDFVVWTPNGLYIERIVEDKSFFEEVKPYLDNYFLGILLPVLLTGRIETVLPETTSNQTSSNTASSCKCDPILENHPYRGIFEF